MVTPPPYDPEYVPVRGHVVWMDFHPQAGTEIWDWRPALVLSAGTFNREKNVAVVCPITRTSRGGPFEIEIPSDLDVQVQGVIRTDQVKSLDWRAREARFLCGMPHEMVWEAASIVHAIIWGE